MKYLIWEKGLIETAVLFAEVVDHSEMSVALEHRGGKVVAAGFCSINPIPPVDLFSALRLEVKTWGQSKSLKIKSRDEDSTIIHKSITYRT